MDSIKSKICDLFGIKYPIIQGGMIWCSGWELASAVSQVSSMIKEILPVKEIIRSIVQEFDLAKAQII